MQTVTLIQDLGKSVYDGFLKTLYGEAAVPEARLRYIRAIEAFSSLYPQSTDVRVFSAPGRTEIGGNHTDHQHGCVLAGAIHLDAIAVVSFHKERVVRVKSQGFAEFTLSLEDMDIHPDANGPEELVRGVLAQFIHRGAEIEGFNLYCTSNVLGGSGLSSSAAFEVLIGTIIDTCCMKNPVGAIEIAKIGQYAENVYYGKACGLMDPMASSVGGLVFIDFTDTEKPQIAPLKFDFEKYGYYLCITDTRSDHIGLSGEYDALRKEMEQVAAYFGKPWLGAASETDFYREIGNLRKTCSDRALLRAAHFFRENARVKAEFSALSQGDMDAFLDIFSQCGRSSETLLQNHYSTQKSENQAISLGVFISRQILGESAAARVHGGGFGGTIQALVPMEKIREYKKQMAQVFGENACQILKIRPVGGCELKKECSHS